MLSYILFMPMTTCRSLMLQAYNKRLSSVNIGGTVQSPKRCSCERGTRYALKKVMVRLKVKEVAQAKGHNMSSLARRADIAFTTVKKIFRDPYVDVSTYTLDKLAKALDVDVRELLESVPDDPGSP